MQVGLTSITYITDATLQRSVNQPSSHPRGISTYLVSSPVLTTYWIKVNSILSVRLIPVWLLYNNQAMKPAMPTSITTVTQKAKSIAHYIYTSVREYICLETERDLRGKKLYLGLGEGWH